MARRLDGVELARFAREHFTLRFDYSDRRQTASQRRVEPYRIVNAGQRAT